MDKSTKSRSLTTAEHGNGHNLLKFSQAAVEHVNKAKSLSNPGSDAELKKAVEKLQELTECTEDQAVTALYDCENDLERAVDLLLDKFRGIDDDWHTSGKKVRSKHVNNASGKKNGYSSAEKTKKEKNILRLTLSKESNKEEVNDTESSKSPPRIPDVHGPRRTINVKNHPSKALVDLGLKNAPTKASSKVHPTNAKDFNAKSKTSLVCDGWDPYTEYGEWGGEAIEVVNSNASYAHSEDFLPHDFTETGSKLSHDASECSTHSADEPLSIKSTNQSIVDSLFISKALSAPPPPAFKTFPDAPVFFVPELMMPVQSKFSFKFGGESFSPFRNISENMTSAKSTPNKSRSSLPCGNGNRPDVEPRNYTYGPSCSVNTSTNFDLPQTSGEPVSDCSVHADHSGVNTEKSPPCHLQSANVIADAQKEQSDATFPSDRSNAQSGFLESSLKNYLLDNLSPGMTKLSVNNAPSQDSTPSQFNLPPVSQSQQSITHSFAYNQGGNASIQHLNKVPITHMTTHSSTPLSQHPMVSGASHQPQTASLQPGMPHFISQFAPPAYHMFNLSGSSNNPPAIFDIEHLQFLQQQRMFYDMQLQQQAATTAQNLLTSSSDSPATTKPQIANAMGHVTAANTGVRPDLLAPQMMPQSHPYFSYPGFVLMNGYTSPFLNQQQSGTETGQSQGVTQGGPSISHHQSQPAGSQPFGSLKPPNTGNVYEDFFNMKYSDPSKQVGFKTNTQGPNNFTPFQGHVVPVDGSKISTTHSTSGVLGQEFNINSGPAAGGAQQFSQFYPPGAAASPYLTAAAVAVAAAAAASAQQQQQQQQASSNGNTSNPSNTGVSSVAVGAGNPSGGNPGGHGQLHPAQTLVMGTQGPSLHHHRHHQQRSVMSHQH